MRPQSIAIVGASRTPASLGRRVLDALVANGYRGCRIVHARICVAAPRRD